MKLNKRHIINPEYSSFDKLFLLDPTLENVLDIISKDTNAFNLDFMTEISKKGANSMLGEWIKKYTESTMKKYVSSYLLKENRLTLNGKIHLIYLKKGWAFWAMVFAFISVIIAIIGFFSKNSNADAPKREHIIYISHGFIHNKIHNTPYIKYNDNKKDSCSSFGSKEIP